MNATRQLHDLGQSLWLDNITRGLLNSGTLARYIDDLSVTGSRRTRRSSEQAIGHLCTSTTRADSPQQGSWRVRGKCFSNWPSKT